MEILTDSNVTPKEICLTKREPVLLKGYVKQWPAMGKWTWDYLKQLAADDAVKLVVGTREYGQTQFTHLKLADYIDIIANPETRSNEEKLYLKEFDLLEEYPVLAEDVQYDSFFPEHVTAYKSAWIGQKGAVTGMHYDLFNNFLTQIRGAKTCRLLPNQKVSRKYYSDKFDHYARISTLDAFNLNGHTQDLEPIAIDLEPGDVLYIPKGWWHQVKSLDPSISIASFMVSSREGWTVGLWEEIRKYIHDKGFYKKGNCTCHN